ncbi:MAG: hypothetical protein ABJB03_11830 [Rhodoglobus sp.]
MSSVSEDYTRSPQEIDPLSWFTGPRLPIVLSVVAAAQAAASIVAHWSEWSIPVLQVVAAILVLSCGLITSTATGPTRPRFGPRRAALVLGIVGLAVILSALGTAGGRLDVEQWWAPIAAALTFASLAPYSSVRQLGAYAAPMLGLVAASAAFAFVPTEQFWRPLGTILIGTGPMIVATIASMVFVHSAVHSMRLAMERPEQTADDTTAAADPDTLARASARVAPFLEQVARAGVVTEADRGLAAYLARRLRSDLVAAADQSWLEQFAAEAGLVVADPSHLADDMNEAQRSALRGLLGVVGESPVVERDSTLIELRAQHDGSTAVALSIDMDLPEGRRLTLLAPYYLTLQTTVENLSWEEGSRLRLRFQLPPN